MRHFSAANRFYPAEFDPDGDGRVLTALPDTQLWRRLQSEGRLLAESSGNNMEKTLNFIPKMDQQVLVEGYKTILRTIYSPTEYHKRAYDSLRNLNTDDVPPGRKLTAENMRAALRVIFKLGVLDPSRKSFWQFMGRVYGGRRDMLPEALTLAAMGYHFRKITEQYCR